MKQIIIRASQSDFGQVDFYSYLPKGQDKENGGCSTPVAVQLNVITLYSLLYVLIPITASQKTMLSGATIGFVLFMSDCLLEAA